MRHFRSFLLLSLLFALIIFPSCSGGGNPVSPDKTGGALEPIPAIDMVDANDGMNGLGIMGAYELTIDPVKMTAEIVGKRMPSIGEDYIVSGIHFFTMAPCVDCLKILGLGLEGSNIALKFRIEHPFVPGDPGQPPTARNRLDLDIFDTAMLIKPVAGTPVNYQLTGESIYSGVIENANGYTRELSSVITDTVALPYVLVLDDTVGGSSTFNKFAMGTTKEFQVTFILTPDSSICFDMYLTFGYGASAKRPQRLTPKYYNPEFNRKAAWKVEAEVQGEWTDTDSTTPVNVEVKVYDWQIGATVYATPADFANAPTDNVYAAGEVSSVSVEIPGMNNTLPVVSTAASGTGTPSDPLIFNVPVTNQNLLPTGEYTGIVRVADTRPCLAVADGRDIVIDTPDGILLENYTMPEYATYQTFDAIIVSGSSVELLAPNGGEEWTIQSLKDITWITTNYTGMIKLEYSKDGFVSEINPIVNSTDDDGIYEWEIPDDVSDTVRVRATLVGSPSVHDDSNSDFSIIAIQWSDKVLIDSNSRMPRAIQNANNEIVLMWHKNGAGVTYSYNGGSGWATPQLGYSTDPSFMHVVADQSGRTVYASYKGVGSGGDDRHALRWTGNPGSLDYMWLYGYTGQPSILLPDDDGSFTHIYTYNGGLQVIGFNSWGSGWTGMTWYDGNDVLMASTNFHERNATNHLLAFHRNSGAVNWARFVRFSKSDINTHSQYTIYQGVTGETVDPPGLCMDTSGRLHVAWRVFDGTNHKILYSNSTDSGSTWSSPQTLINSTAPILSEYVGIDSNSSNRIYITYTYNVFIYMIYSDNYSNWSTTSSPDDSGVLPIGYHYTQPFPLVTSDDVLHVFFLMKDSIFTHGNLYEVTY